MYLMERLKRLGPGNAPPQEAHMPLSQLALINFTADHPGCGVQELADGLLLSTPTISISVRQLEKSGYLSRQVHPQDKRAIQLYLTTKGEDFYQRTFEFRRKKFEYLLSGLSESERRQLIELLGKAMSTVEHTEYNDIFK